MRRKATPKKRSLKGAIENDNGSMEVEKNTDMKPIKQILKPDEKTQTGKGLGKAAARRMGQLLKRVFKKQEESKIKGNVSLPKTPIRFFKHQINTMAEKTPQTNKKTPTGNISQLILDVVSQWKHQRGISMAELKQMLAARGYDVPKNNKRVAMATQRLINSDTLTLTTRSATYKLNPKKLTNTKRVRLDKVPSPKSKGDLQLSKTASKSSKVAEKPQRPARVHKPKVKACKPVAKSRKPADKTSKTIAKSQKPRRKTPKTSKKTHKPRRKTPKTSRKPHKPAGKKRKPAKIQAARFRRAQRKHRKTQRRQPKQNKHRYKYSQKRQRPRRRQRSKTWQRPVARRRVYYY
ncbi:histone H1B-like [Plectropomus leopardus]|uniref:histone H1B-like n=1 Tax=Plectropomus leopardus TaxID=160734 RepID=UPI001C4C634E|nr:histone H1B-like [Plectropomus leopardus]